MTKAAPLRADRFASAAAHYIAARPRYAPRLIERLVGELGIDEGSRVLDLGCGPGTLAIPIARYAGTVTGIDPSTEMIAAAARLSALAGVVVDWRVGSSEAIAADLAPLHLVVMGRSFHWMDREATLARLDALIPKDGAIALLSTESLPFPEGRWLAVYDAVRAEFEQADDFAAYRKSALWEPHYAVLLRSPFGSLTTLGVIEEREATLDELVSRALSHSTTTPKVLGEACDAFVATLRSRLLAVCPAGRFPEIIESVALIARRTD